MNLSLHDHVKPELKQLHWLPVEHCITHKLFCSRTTSILDKPYNICQTVYLQFLQAVADTGMSYSSALRISCWTWTWWRHYWLWWFSVAVAIWCFAISLDFYLREVRPCDCWQFVCETLHDCCFCISWRLPRSWMIMCWCSWRIRTADLSYRSVLSASTRCICHSLRTPSRRFVITEDRQFPLGHSPYTVGLGLVSGVALVGLWKVQ